MKAARFRATEANFAEYVYFFFFGDVLPSQFVLNYALDYTANVSGHFMVGLHFERWETMDKYHIVTIVQFA